MSTRHKKERREQRRQEQENNALTRAEINKQNAQHSTGPKDTSKTRYNALKHGFRGKFVVLPGECQAEYDDLLQGLLDEWQPQGLTATITVVQLTQAVWLQMRAVREENRVCELCDTLDEQSKQVNLMADYRRKAERSTTRLIKQLQHLQQLQAQGVYQPLADEAFRPELLLNPAELAEYMDCLVPRMGEAKPTQAQADRQAEVHQVKVAMSMRSFDPSKYSPHAVKQADLELGMGYENFPNYWRFDENGKPRDPQ